MKAMTIIIPCYNEENRFALSEYTDFLIGHPEMMLCFVNDGSQDGTLQVLKGLQLKFPHNIYLLSSEQNVGKAGAIRKGFFYCNRNIPSHYIAYLDADLATSLEECQALISDLKEGVVFVFGSRIKKLGSTISRKRSRFIIGRIIATLISTILRLPVYDTQCGCKLFTREAAAIAFDAPFISRWLFDVEIFQRLLLHYGRENAVKKMLEIPLKRWVDRGTSKVKPSYFLSLWYDLYKIRKWNIQKTRSAIPTSILISTDG